MAGSALLMILGLVVTACQPQPVAYSSNVYGDLEDLHPEGQVITYWYYHTDEREAALLAMVDEFNATNEWGITVQGEYAGRRDEIETRILSAIPTGEVPHLIEVYPYEAATYAALGGLVDLTPYVESGTWGIEEEEDLLPFVMDTAALPQLEGMYALPTGRSMELLYYNVDWLNELGYENPPHTWEEFREMACAASGDSATYGYALSIDALTFIHMLVNWDGQFIQLDPPMYTFATSEGGAVLTFLQELVEEGCVVIEAEPYGDRAAFGAGEILFAAGSTSELPAFRRAVAEQGGFNWSISTFPTSLESPRPAIYGSNLAIFETTPREQLAAWLFIRWFIEPYQQARWAQASSYLPVRSSTVDRLEDYLATDPMYEKSFEFLLSYETVGEPGVVGYEHCRQVVKDMLRAVVEGAEPEATLVAAEEECNLSLETTSDNTE
jgi:multiple sugar transport system substrate-binding protein/sn-glycerol 3-phosphate transport system substrate-binding protein